MTDRQALFVSYYLGEAGFNATKAAFMAGFAHPNVSSARLLVNVSIRRAIDERLDQYAMPSKEVLSRLSNLGRSDMGDFLSFTDADDPHLDLKRARKLRKLGVIKKIKQTTRKVKDGDEWVTERTLEVELNSAIKPLELLAKHHGLLRENQPIDTPGDAILAKHREALDEAYGLDTSHDPGGSDGGLPA